MRIFQTIVCSPVQSSIYNDCFLTFRSVMNIFNSNIWLSTYIYPWLFADANLVGCEWLQMRGRLHCALVHNRLQPSTTKNCTSQPYKIKRTQWEINRRLTWRQWDPSGSLCFYSLRSHSVSLRSQEGEVNWWENSYRLLLLQTRLCLFFRKWENLKFFPVRKSMK